MTQFFETMMLVCFGLSWPISVLKSYKARTAKGKSVMFTIVIMCGYLCGIASKLTAENVSVVLILYVVNLLIVSVDCALYFRNRAIDRREYTLSITTEKESSIAA